MPSYNWSLIYTAFRWFSMHHMETSKKIFLMYNIAKKTALTYFQPRRRRRQSFSMIMMMMMTMMIMEKLFFPLVSLNLSMYLWNNQHISTIIIIIIEENCRRRRLLSVSVFSTLITSMTMMKKSTSVKNHFFSSLSHTFYPKIIIFCISLFFSHSLT